MKPTRTRLSLLFFSIAALLGACSTPVVQPTGEATVTPELNDTHFIAHDGARLPLRRWTLEGVKPRAVVIALHGFNDYSNFFADPGAFLAAQGIMTYAFDQRGFGAAPSPGFWPGIAALRKDLETIVTLVRSRHSDTPLYLLGASMGGAVVLVTARQSPTLNVDGVILSAPAVWGRETMPWYQTTMLWISAHTMPGARLTGRGLDIMASDNIDMLRALGRDPLVIKKTRIDSVYGLTNLMDAALDAARDLDLPTLILYGEKDEIIPRKPTDLMLSRLPEAASSKRKTIFYGDGYHMLLRDLQADTVWRDITQWIASRPGRTGSQSATGD